MQREQQWLIALEQQHMGTVHPFDCLSNTIRAIGMGACCHDDLSTKSGDYIRNFTIACCHIYICDGLRQQRTTTNMFNHG